MNWCHFGNPNPGEVAIQLPTVSRLLRGGFCLFPISLNQARQASHGGPELDRDRDR
jgi:hypothetical protein